MPTRDRVKQERLRQEIADARAYGSLVGIDAAAQYLGLSAGTLRNWNRDAFKGDRPRRVRFGSAVRYRLADLDEYAARNVSR